MLQRRQGVNEWSALVRLENATRFREDDICQSSRQGGADLITQVGGPGLLHAAIRQSKVSVPNVQIFVPGCVNRGPEKDAPLRVEATAAAGHVSVTREDRLRFGFD